jgi:glucokinase
VNDTASDSSALGVDIGGTFIKAGIVNTSGKLLQQFQEPSPRDQDSLRNFIHRAIKEAQAPLAGIGIACKGIIDAENSRINRLPGDLHFLEGSSFPDLINVALPVRADNDARTALLAEVLWGAARSKRNVILLTLGTGIGGAAMVDGVILHGAGGIAGHFGHIISDNEGGLCMCGNRGCLETVFSSRAIEADYFSHIHRAVSTSQAVNARGEVPRSEAIFQAAQNGDESARRVIDRAMEHLSASIVSLLHILDPELVVIGGNMAAADDQLLSPIRRAISTRSACMMGREVPVTLQSAVGYGGVLGAAGLVFLHQHMLSL